MAHPFQYLHTLPSSLCSLAPFSTAAQWLELFPAVCLDVVVVVVVIVLPPPRLRFYHISCSGAKPCPSCHSQPCPARLCLSCAATSSSGDAFYAFSLFRISIFNLAIFFANLLSDFCTVYLAAPPPPLHVGFRCGNVTLNDSKQRGG